MRETRALSPDRIFVEDIRFYGHHGVTRAQQTVGSWFSVDVELSMDLEAAAVSDDVRATVDYGLVAACVAEIGTGKRVNLLERLASVIARSLLAEFPCEESASGCESSPPRWKGCTPRPASPW